MLKSKVQSSRSHNRKALLANLHFDIVLLKKLRIAFHFVAPLK